MSYHPQVLQIELEIEVLNLCRGFHRASLHDGVTNWIRAQMLFKPRRSPPMCFGRALQMNEDMPMSIP